MSNTLPNDLAGVPVTIVSPVLCHRIERRTWRERLFTTPFTPFTPTKTVERLVEVLEDDQIVETSQGLFMNATTFKRCEHALRSTSNER